MLFYKKIEQVLILSTSNTIFKKPLCNLMLDELRFAIKCGGPAKKVQLSSTTALSLKLPSNVRKNEALRRRSLEESMYGSGGISNHPGSGILIKSRGKSANECKKCEEIIKNNLLNKIKPDNALVCKHNSMSNLSINNPGIVLIYISLKK
jgi:hypothetical protein